jgi:hypothetical protein
MSNFTPVNARARGLAAHLFTRAELEALAAAEPGQLPRALNRSGKLHLPVNDQAGPPELEQAVRATVKRHQATLARWAGAAPLLAVFDADQDLRSLRALLRGAQQAAPAAARLSGLLPTAALPERALAELARQPTAALVASHLLVLGHPDAPGLVALTAHQAQPDLFALDLQLVQGFAARARAAARRGDANLRGFVACRLDVCNAQAALLLGGCPEVDPARCFVPGGAHLEAPVFTAAAKAGSPAEASRVLREALAGTPLEGLVPPLAVGAALGSQVEQRGLTSLLEAQRRAARARPLCSAPALLVLLRLDAMSRDVRRLAWGSELGAPASLVRPELVTPWR